MKTSVTQNSADLDSALEGSLIQMVEDRAQKWDVTHPSYHKKTMKDQSFEDIAIALSFSGNGMYSLVVFCEE